MGILTFLDKSLQIKSALNSRNYQNSNISQTEAAALSGVCGVYYLNFIACAIKHINVARRYSSSPLKLVIVTVFLVISKHSGFGGLKEQNFVESGSGASLAAGNPI